MSRFSRRAFVAGGLMTPFVARAQTSWPSGTIQLVVPYAPGGGGDMLARLIQPKLQQKLGTTVIVENRDGAASSVGSNYVAQGPRDGSRWLINAEPLALNPAMLPSLPYDTEKSFDPIYLFGTFPLVLATNPSKPYKTLNDVLTAARSTENGLGIGTIGGSGGVPFALLLSKLAGVKLTPIPYRGGAPVLNDILAGHIELIASAATLVPHIESGKIRAIAQAGPTRHFALPDVPTIAESGFPNFEAQAWWGMFAPLGTPKPIVDRFVAELDSVIKEPEISERLRTALRLDLKYAKGAEFKPFFDNELKKWGTVVRESGLRSDR